MSSYVLFFFELSNNIKLYHWTTTSFARHKASDELFESVISLTDQFLEVYIGKFGRPRFTERATPKLNIRPLNDRTVVEYITASIERLMELSKQLSSKDDTDLLNIRDELLGKLNQTLYLFTLD